MVVHIFSKRMSIFFFFFRPGATVFISLLKDSLQQRMDRTFQLWLEDLETEGVYCLVTWAVGY